MTASKSQRRAILTEDGELRDLDSLLNEPQPGQEPQYCTRCGTENLPEANFCRKCGKSLEAEAVPAIPVPMVGKPKRKHVLQDVEEHQTQSAVQSAAEMNIFAALTRLITMVFVAGMVVTSMIPFGDHESSPASALFVLLAWFLVEAVRSDKMRRATVATMILEAGTMVFIAGMVITSFVFGTRAISLVILLAWFLVEAVRS